VSRSDDTGAEAVPILSGQTKQIRDMLEKLLEANPRRSDFTFNESSLRELQEGDLTTNVLLMIGPKKDLEVLKTYAQALDENLCRTAGIAYSKDLNDLDRIYEVVDLKFIEPALAAFDLKNRIRGLYVTALPDPVTPTETGLGTQKDEKNDQTKTPEGQTQQQQVKKDELEKVIGREPMKLVLRGTKKQIDEAKSYLAMVDVQPKQVAFEIRVLELTREEAMRMGLDWSLLTGGRLQNFRFNQGSGDTASSPGTISGAYRYRAGDVVNFLAALDQSNNGRRIIARPNALVTDGRATKIFVGDTIRYIESIQSNQNGVTIQTNSLDVGVFMKFMARIGSEGNIALKLEQNFNILNGFTPVPGGGQLPQTSERRAENFVNMRTGEIVAFGGLLLEQERKRVSGIPILKDLPLLGPFFSRTEREKEKTEIVFLLAAVEVTDGNRTDAASPRKAATSSPDPVKDYLRTGSGNPPR
jgi:type II secretory pathway component GspD/PulD (secretin)